MTDPSAAAGTQTPSHALQSSVAEVAKQKSRLALVDALRAAASSIIAWHHFASYPPLAEWAMPVAGGLIVWLSEYARATQVFFVLSGFMMARSLSRDTWNLRRVGRFVVQRYCRLGLPYLAAILLAIGACSLARGTLDESVLGPPPTWQQVLAHVVFLQSILGYDSLSAGLWFVCINFQLGLIYVAVLSLAHLMAGKTENPAQSRWARLPMGIGWLLAASSLFYFNLDDRWDIWALYFFGQFFLGVVAYEALCSSRGRVLLAIYVAMMVAAILFEWRWRLVTTLAAGMMLFIGARAEVQSRWLGNRVVNFLGRTSYSLFLVHFPVMIVVATIWTRAEWSLPDEAILGLVVAYLASLQVAGVFYRVVEVPATKLSRGLA